MNITYDPDADAAYISIVGAIAPGEAARQVSFVEAPGSESMVTLDFDANGYLLGIEILFASRTLRPEVLAQAEPPPRT